MSTKIPPIADHIFFVATTKQEKIDQFNALAQHYKHPALFLPISALGKPAHSPAEDEANYEEHMLLKCQTAASYLRGFTREQADEALRTLGFSEDRIRNAKLYGCAEDSGIIFEEKKRAARDGKPGFTDIFFNTAKGGPYKSDADREIVRGLERFRLRDPKSDKPLPFPGTETIRVFNGAGGVENFLRLVNQAAKFAGLHTDPKGKADEKCLHFTDQSTIGVFEWNPLMGRMGDAIDVRKAAHICKGQTRNVYMAPRNTGEMDSYMAFVPPKSAREGSFITRRDLGIIYQPAARLQAYEHMINGRNRLNIKPVREWTSYVVARSHSLSVAYGDRKYRVAMALGSSDEQAEKARASMAESCGKERMELWQGGELAGSDEGRKLWNNLQHFENLLKENDAFVCMPTKGGEIEKTLLLSYLAIHKQLDPAGKGKTIILNEAGHRDCWKDAHQQFVTMFNRGSYGDRPSRTFQFARTNEEALNLLREARIHYREVREDPRPDLSRAVPDVKDTTGRYNVCVFASAALEGVFEDKANELGYQLQKEGMALAFGASDRNMMGGLYKGSLRHEQETGKRKVIIGTSTPNIVTQETEHGRAPAAMDHFYEAPDITARKRYLFKNSHAFVCLEGGPGTLDELLTWMWFKEHEPAMMKDKPMIIAESAYVRNPLFHKVVDLYLGKSYSALTAAEKEKSGILLMKQHDKVCETNGELYKQDVRSIMTLLKQHRRDHHPDLQPTAKSTFAGRTSAGRYDPGHNEAYI